MKRIYCFLITLLLCATAMAQSSTNPDYFSQMWNISNTYYGTVNVNTVGNQLDTINGATGYFTSSYWKGTYDSARLSPLYRDGNLGMDITCLRAGASTATVTVTPQQSGDGITWCTIPGITVATLTPSSLTVPVTTAFNFLDIYEKYYRFMVTTVNAAGCAAHLTYKQKKQ